MTDPQDAAPQHTDNEADPQHQDSPDMQDSSDNSHHDEELAEALKMFNSDV